MPKTNDQSISEVSPIGLIVAQLVAKAVGWDQCPVGLFVRDNGPILRLVSFGLPLALLEHFRCSVDVVATRIHATASNA